MIQFNEELQEQRLRSIREREEERLVEILSQKYQLPYIQIIPSVINLEAYAVLTEEESRKAQVGIFTKTGTTLSVLVFSPNIPETQAMLKRLEEEKYTLNVHMGSRASLNLIWDRYKDISKAKKETAGIINVSGAEVTEIMKNIKSIGDVQKQLEIVLNDRGALAVSHFFKVVLAGAFAIHSSDIHIEPQNDDVRVRYRLDGILYDLILVPKQLYRQLATRIKLLSGLKLNVDKDTQDGRFSIMFSETSVEIRTSILPGQYGEAVVMRILDPASISTTLDALGIPEYLLNILLTEVGKPTGMILTTGPTGAGKTTTLYAILRKILDPQIKIITIEDPIEYHIKGIVQTQVNRQSNYTFLSGLRAALRQDPDVILVGEIRDSETSSIAINSSLTGHLVLSTLHTNNAGGAIPRLIDLKINPKIISSSLNLAMAQRLVRRLCKDCKQQVKTDEKNLELLDHIVERIQFKRPDFKPDTSGMWISAADGCESCNGTGYIGRVGIYEAILMDAAVEDATIKNPSISEIYKAARPQGILTMREDGIVKMFEGMTSIKEIGRVVDLLEDL